MARRRRTRRPRFAAWRTKTADVLAGAAWLGLGALVLQRVVAQQHYNGAPASGPKLPISILKPLTGRDAGLVESLEEFASIPYKGEYEMLLGVESPADPAYPLARSISDRHSHVKVVVTGRGPGLNPKVRQLEAMEPYAAHDILLISDANMRPAHGYLDEISALVAGGASLVTNGYAGVQGGSLGAQLDGLQNVTNTAHQIAGKALGRSFAMGGSEAITRAALERLGGFARYRGVLAEDYLMGRDVEAIGGRVAIGRLSVYSAMPERSVASFAGRVSRWSTMQATATGDAAPAAALGVLNPIPLAAIALGLHPSAAAVKTLGVVTAVKTALDMSHAQAQGAPADLGDALLVPLKDCIQFGAWAKGLVNREVEWRGNKLRVGDGTVLRKP